MSKISYNNETPLTLAIKNRDLRKIDELLNTPDTDLNASNGDGDCPLTLAIKRGIKATAVRLVGMGAEFDLFYDKNKATTVFIAAVENNNTFLVEEILKHRDGLTDSENQIKTALKVCQEYQTDMIEILNKFNPVPDTIPEAETNMMNPNELSDESKKETIQPPESSLNNGGPVTTVEITGNISITEGSGFTPGVTEDLYAFKDV